MFINVRNIRDMIVSATDGHLGKVSQFLFDDQSWAIRYLVVEIGPFVAKEKKLLSPATFVSVGPEGFKVNITTYRIRNSPNIDTDKPVSREKEEELHRYYDWPYYWNNPEYSNTFGTSLYPGYGDYPYSEPLYRDREIAEKAKNEHERIMKSDKNRLRSTKELSGYTAIARGKRIGTIDDFLMDDLDFALRYTIINVDALVPPIKIILASHWTQKIVWDSKSIYFDIDATLIENGPQYNPEMLISRDYESRLFDYYHKPYYWKS
jgi:hypothetical protein